MSTGADAFVCKMMLTMVFHGDLPDLVRLYCILWLLLAVDVAAICRSYSWGWQVQCCLGVLRCCLAHSQWFQTPMMQNARCGFSSVGRYPMLQVSEMENLKTRGLQVSTRHWCLSVRILMLMRMYWMSVSNLNHFLPSAVGPWVVCLWLVVLLFLTWWVLMARDDLRGGCRP